MCKFSYVKIWASDIYLLTKHKNSKIRYERLDLKWTFLYDSILHFPILEFSVLQNETIFTPIRSHTEHS